MRGIAVITLVLMVCLLTGCPVSQSVVFYNNSNQKGAVILPSGVKQWPLKSEFVISDNGGDVGWDDLHWEGDPKVEYIPLFTNSCDGTEYTYKLVFPGLSKKYVGGSGTREYKLQVNADCRLYVVPFNASFPNQDVSQMIEVVPIMRLE